VYRKILVPLEANEQLVHFDYAHRLAGSLGAELVMLCVVPVMASDEPFFRQVQVEVGSAAARRKQEAEALIGTLEEELAADGVLSTGKILVTDKSEADAIVQQAEESSCDLIIMPTYQQSVLSRWFMGSLGEKVRRRSRIPVLFINATS
jgi:nucleotide-binding universal stress UspA family protein